MSLPFLNALPDSTGYRVIYGNEIVNSGPLAGGSSRSRADVIGATGTCDVQWTCGPTLFNYICAFFRVVHNGADSFQTNLILDNSLSTLYTVKFVPATFGVISQIGQTYVIGASLEVTPSTADNEIDVAFVAVYSDYGESAGTVLGMLNFLVNTRLSSSL